ncbi:hypothetical protein [Marinobacter sp. LV10MA510-1]|uniref:hypothetical protein n=1 Tax=Marinobacter sp. LV10MA510-1 TaxID=1415567 RepID=UPI000BF95FC4|nr:hypothetical protein [Marinobacter sp. LV10MA510-1]PFG11471.1 hypothetical protein ATI45_3993 [Marinobacter sp. LV10MA510-1]
MKSNAGHKPDDKNNTATAAEIRPGGEDFKMLMSTRLQGVLRRAQSRLPVQIVTLCFHELASTRAKEER